MVEATPALITAIVVLTLGSIFLVLYLWKKYKELAAIWQYQNRWPPMLNRCPDYWEDKGAVAGDETMTNCKNSHGLGSLELGVERTFKNPNAKDTNISELSSQIKSLGLTWEGVDNY